MTQNETITTENVSRTSLKAVFDAAFIQAEIDDDGDLVVIPTRFKCWIFVPESKDLIRLFTGFRMNDESPVQARLEFVNRVNERFVIARAFVARNGRVQFDYYIPIGDGLTPRTLVQLTRRFMDVVTDAVREEDSDNVFS